MFKNKKTFLVLILSILLVFSATVSSFCKEREEKDDKMLIGIVMPVGGLGDLSFSWMAQLGINKIKQELYGANVSTFEPSSSDMLKSSFQYYVDNKADLIIGIGFPQENALKEIAKQNPKVKFAIIDGKIDLPNVTSVNFREEEGAFLAGSVAAMVSKTGKIGFIGAMKVDLIEKFRKGYEQGAKYINPKITVISEYIGNDISAFSSPDKAKKIAHNMMDDKGVDIIFSAAGGSGLGIIEIVRIHDKYCIGVDSDQDYLAPGNVITSMVKRVDNALFALAENSVKGNFKPGNMELGLKDGGISLTEFKYTRHLLKNDQFKLLEQIKQDIIDRKIKIKL